MNRGRECTPGGLGDWTEHEIATGATGAKFVRIDDIDADGDLDVVGGSSTTQELRWYENLSGDGSSWSATTISATSVSFSNRKIDIGDVDGDGDLDVGAGNSDGSQGLSWWENDGSPEGANWTERLVTASNAVNEVHFRDMDDDGDLDVLTANVSPAVKPKPAPAPKGGAMERWV